VLSGVELIQSITASIDRGQLGDIIQKGDINSLLECEVLCPLSVDFPSAFVIEFVITPKVEGLELPPDLTLEVNMSEVNRGAQDVLDGVRRKIGDEQLNAWCELPIYA
jgi:hypothetical protein